MRPVPVWDFPTRAFHWGLTVAVIVGLLTGEDEGLVFAIHVASGYVIALLLLFRLLWGFIGSAHSRFADFLYSRASLQSYLAALLRFRPPRFVGHNPIGGWMVIILMVSLLATLATGLFAGGEEGFGRHFPFTLVGGSGALGELHEFFGNLIIVLAIIHVVGVLVESVLSRDNLIWAMITGRKPLPEAEAAAEPPLAPAWRGVAAALLVVLVGGYLVQQTDFAALQAKGDGNGREAEQERDDD